MLKLRKRRRCQTTTTGCGNSPKLQFCISEKKSSNRRRESTETLKMNIFFFFAIYSVEQGEELKVENAIAVYVK